MTEASKSLPYMAFILAAGFGTRLRPYTDEVPKPMVQLNGKSLLWHTLDKLMAAGIKEIVVNAHYKAEMIKEHMDEYMAASPDNVIIHTSFEDDVLDTGGGVKHALPYFDEDKPFYVIAGDNLWTDGDFTGALDRLAQGWDDQNMDIFTLMQPLDKMILTEGVGDYDLAGTGKVRRSMDKSGSHMWTNIRLNHPRIYKGITEDAFSFLPLMDECEKSGRLRAIEHKGDWHHISTPKDLRAVDVHMKEAG